MVDQPTYPIKTVSRTAAEDKSLDLPPWLYLPTDDYDHELQAAKDRWAVHGDGFKW